MRRLSVPYFKQDTAYSCGAAVAQMVLRYHGIVRSEESLMRELGTNPEIGTTHGALIQALTEAGLHCYTNDGSTLEEVRFYLEAETPVLVHYVEPSDEEGHYAVAVAVDTRTVVLNDPWNGEGFELPAAEFDARWRSGGGRSPRWMMACAREPFSIGRTYSPRL